MLLFYFSFGLLLNFDHMHTSIRDGWIVIIVPDLSLVLFTNHPVLGTKGTNFYILLDDAVIKSTHKRVIKKRVIIFSFGNWQFSLL